MATTTRSTFTLAQALSRILASIFGGYFFLWGLVTLSITSLVTMGLPYDQVRTSCMITAFLLYLVVFLWAYTVKSLTVLWVSLIGSGTAMTALAWVLLTWQSNIG